MEKFYKSLRAIILFLIVMLVIETAFGDKTTQKTAILILISMLLINADTLSNFLNSATSVFDVNATTTTTTTTITTTSPSDSGQSTTHSSNSGYVHGDGGRSI